MLVVFTTFEKRPLLVSYALYLFPHHPLLSGSCFSTHCSKSIRIYRCIEQVHRFFFVYTSVYRVDLRKFSKAKKILQSTRWIFNSVSIWKAAPPISVYISNPSSSPPPFHPKGLEYRECINPETVLYTIFWRTSAKLGRKYIGACNRYVLTNLLYFESISKYTINEIIECKLSYICLSGPLICNT